MSTILMILLCMLIIVSIILVGIQINNTLNKQANFIIEISKKEGFLTPNAAWNDANSFLQYNNYLMTTNQNKIYSGKTPAYIPSTNATRGSTVVLNDILPTSQQRQFPDANSKTGYINSSKWPGITNWTKLSPMKSSTATPIPTTKPAPSMSTTTKPSSTSSNNGIQIDGAEIKTDPIVYEENSPVKVQSSPNLSVVEKDMDIPFSTNSRQNSSEAVNLLKTSASPNLSAMKETFNKSYKFGKFK